MTMNISSPVTGGAQTGFTSPTYTLVVDVAPDINGKQWAVSALGGTQAAVLSNLTSNPFTITFIRPKAFAPRVRVNDISQLMTGNPGFNDWRIIVRKGIGLIGAGGRTFPMMANCLIRVPAGGDTDDPANVRACISLLVGALNQLSAGIGDSLVTGIA